MILELKLEGTGDDDDPWRAPVPTGTLLAIDYDAKTGIVDVRDEDMPDGELTEQAWHEHLDMRYLEHAGTYRPRLV